MFDEEMLQSNMKRMADLLNESTSAIQSVNDSLHEVGVRLSRLRNVTQRDIASLQNDTDLLVNMTRDRNRSTYAVDTSLARMKLMNQSINMSATAIGGKPALTGNLTTRLNKANGTLQANATEMKNIITTMTDIRHHLEVNLSVQAERAVINEMYRNFTHIPDNTSAEVASIIAAFKA